MPPKDYAHRSRKPRQPAKRGGSKAAPKRNVTTLLLAIVAGLLVLVIVGGLILHKDREPKPAPAAAATPKTKTEADPLPEKPKEKWDYIQELENKEVEVDVPEPPKDGPWRLQCGSFRISDQAEALRARIAFAGLEAAVRTSTDSNGAAYRVVLGPYERRHEAEKDNARLRRNKISSCAIWKW